MKFPLYLSIFFFVTSLWAKESILLTSFEPFKGSTTNNSMAVANSIAHYFQNSSELSITLCQLPVIYDQAAKKALACINKMVKRPKIVLSLGESGCSIRFESRALNRDFDPSTADNKYQVRNNREILKHGPAEIKFNLPMHKMYCAEKDADIRDDFFSASKNMGGFVCNNTAYLLANTLSKKFQYGFIHVPRTVCQEYGDPQKIAYFIINAIKAVAIPQKSDKRAIPSICSNQLQTAAIKESRVQEFSSLVDSLKDELCYKEFLE